MPVLHDAVKKGKASDVLRELTAGADVEEQDKEGRSGLHIAGEEGNEEIVKLLLERDADVDAEDADGNTPLHLAARGGHVEVCKQLLEKADVDAENGDGNTPVWLAFEAGKSECAEMLLRSGEAEVNAQCENGMGYLHQAAADGRTADVELLLSLGATVDLLDRARFTALHHSAKAGQWDAGRKLVEAGANVKAVGEKLTTPLHFTALNGPGRTEGSVEFAELLLEKGADPSAKNQEYQRPVDLIGMAPGSRSKKQLNADDDMRALLEEAEENM